MQELDNRFSSTQLCRQSTSRRPAGARQDAAHRQSGLGKVVKENESQLGRLDIATLKPGDVIEGRYSSSKRSAKALSVPYCSWKTPWYEERLILKFLNPNVPRTKR